MKFSFFQKLKNGIVSSWQILKMKVLTAVRYVGPSVHAWLFRLKGQQAAHTPGEPSQKSRPTSKAVPFRINWQLVKINAIPLCLVAIMLVLLSGSMQTLAWYTDEDKNRNEFIVGDMNLKVYYKNDIVPQYTEMNTFSNVFNDRALYEPGYTQVVYFKIVNEGDVAFDYTMTVKEADWIDSLSVNGDPLHLADHLRFGLAVSDSEYDLDRELARLLEDGEVEEKLHTIGEHTEDGYRTLYEQDVDYGVLMVYMPESVGNEANYRGVQPQTILGVKVYAQQEGTMTGN